MTRQLYHAVIITVQLTSSFRSRNAYVIFCITQSTTPPAADSEKMPPKISALATDEEVRELSRLMRQEWVDLRVSKMTCGRRCSSGLTNFFFVIQDITRACIEVFDRETNETPWRDSAIQECIEVYQLVKLALNKSRLPEVKRDIVRWNILHSLQEEGRCGS